MKVKSFIYGYALALFTFAACGSITYKYYGLNLPDECYDKGMMLGKSGSGGWDDVRFDQCKPDDVVKGKCILMFREEFFKAKTETEQCRQQLSDCQRGQAPK